MKLLKRIPFVLSIEIYSNIVSILLDKISEQSTVEDQSTFIHTITGLFSSMHNSL